MQQFSMSRSSVSQSALNLSLQIAKCLFGLGQILHLDIQIVTYRRETSDVNWNLLLGVTLSRMRVIRIRLSSLLLHCKDLVNEKEKGIIFNRKLLSWKCAIMIKCVNSRAFCSANCIICFQLRKKSGPDGWNTSLTYWFRKETDKKAKKLH